MTKTTNRFPQLFFTELQNRVAGYAQGLYGTSLVLLAIKKINQVPSKLTLRGRYRYLEKRKKRSRSDKVAFEMYSTFASQFDERIRRLVNDEAQHRTRGEK